MARLADPNAIFGFSAPGAGRAPRQTAGPPGALPHIPGNSSRRFWPRRARSGLSLRCRAR